MFSTSDPRWWIGLGGALALTAGLLAVAARPATSRPAATTDNSNQARPRYAALYQGAWRQDSGQGAVLMTATLFAPPLVSTLGQQADRFEVEEQLWRAMKELPTTAVPIVLTLDSVSGAIPDQAIQTSLTLTDDDGMVFRFSSWTPVIAPARPVNTNVPTTSQMGVAVFTAGEAIDWEGLGSLRLVSANIADQPKREFVWAQPRLLLQTPE